MNNRPLKPNRYSETVMANSLDREAWILRFVSQAYAVEV
jgi:hypothetical protein